MFTLSNILLTILWIFIIFSIVLGIWNIMDQDTFFVPIPFDTQYCKENILTLIIEWYLFICSWVIILFVIGLIFTFALFITRNITNPEEFPKSENTISYEKNQPIREDPQTKSICNWVGFAKNIIEEQERQGYRYTGTSSGIICEEQLNFVKIRK